MMYDTLCLCVALLTFHVVAADHAQEYNLTRRVLSSHCDSSALTNSRYANYFQDMTKIYRGQDDGTCLPLHHKCGWPKETFGGKKLPLYVLVVGLEGSGHHFWTKLLFDPLFQCNWVNACASLYIHYLYLSFISQCFPARYEIGQCSSLPTGRGGRRSSPHPLGTGDWPQGAICYPPQRSAQRPCVHVCEGLL